MTASDVYLGVRGQRKRLLDRVAEAVKRMQEAAVALDATRSYPAVEIEFLHQAGALSAPLPLGNGGLGMGTEPSGGHAVMHLLRLIGQANLSLGRLFEAHVNALHLIHRFGTCAQTKAAADDATRGLMYGLWVTDAHHGPLLLSDSGALSGIKAPCSGAGHLRRALVTARMPDGETRMVMIAVTEEHHADQTGWDTHGMRAACNGAMALDNAEMRGIIGGAGDYLRQPDFSAGAWRTSAVTLGGMEALAGEFRSQLIARGRDADPHQQARVGHALLAVETARMWVARAAGMAEGGAGEPGDIANVVNLARLAVEAACLDLLRIVQTGLGLAAFRSQGLVELLSRDLAMYLRQPAPDETLTTAATYFMRRGVPAADVETGQPAWA